jgi:hypothetical protein
MLSEFFEARARIRARAGGDGCDHATEAEVGTLPRQRQVDCLPNNPPLYAERKMLKIAETRALRDECPHNNTHCITGGPRPRKPGSPTAPLSHRSEKHTSHLPAGQLMERVEAAQRTSVASLVL